MKLLDRIISRLASPEDQALLAKPNMTLRLRVIARTAMRYLWLYLILLLISVAWVGAAGNQVYHKTESPEMCKGCHEMGQNFQSWANSRHHAIKCVDCHANPGITGWVAAKSNGLLQLYTHLTVEKVDPNEIEFGQRHEDMVSRNCARCHDNSARVDERDGRRMAHARHAEVGIGCIQCHSGRVAHPATKELAKTYVNLADTDACFKCHDGKNKVNGPKGLVTAFGLTDEGSCTKCHPDSKHAVDHFGDSPKSKSLKPCLECHEHKQDGRHYLLDHNNLSPMCGKCHERLKEGASYVSKHKPFADGKCNTCHQVMAPGYLFKDGPKPTKAFCLSCHQDIAGALAMPKATTLTTFNNDGADLHASHAQDASDQGEMLCLACHDGHGSQASRAMIFLRPAEKGGQPGKYVGTPSGGTCSGSCHDETGNTYNRAGSKPAEPAAAPAAPTPADAPAAQPADKKE